MARHFGKLGQCFYAWLFGAALVATPAAAADMSGVEGHPDASKGLGAPGGPEAPMGTLAMVPGADWATPLEDAEMAELRGGFFDVSFGITFQVGELPVATGALTFGDNIVPPSELDGFTGAASGDFSAFTNSFESMSGVMQVLSIENAQNVVALQTMNINIYTMLSPQPTQVQLNALPNLLSN